MIFQKKGNSLNLYFMTIQELLILMINILSASRLKHTTPPSALDPYGGSITGIVGVNRDIMGTGKGAKPFFNTNVLCFGEPDTPEESIPEGLLHPSNSTQGGTPRNN